MGPAESLQVRIVYSTRSCGSTASPSTSMNVLVRRTPLIRVSVVLDPNLGSELEVPEAMLVTSVPPQPARTVTWKLATTHWPAARSPGRKSSKSNCTFRPSNDPPSASAIASVTGWPFIRSEPGTYCVQAGMASVTEMPDSGDEVGPLQVASV